MKKEAFDFYVQSICKIYGFPVERLIEQTKNRDVTTARYLLYYLCYNRPMTLALIQMYMAELGLKVSHPTIIYGVRSIRKRMHTDKDIIQVLNRIK